MRKLYQVALSILVVGSLIGCSKAEDTSKKDTGQERIQYVKESLLDTGMKINTEVTPTTLDKYNKNTDNIISFGKNQLYELSGTITNKEQSRFTVYQKFESSKKGKQEGELLFNTLKESVKEVAKDSIKDTSDKKTGDKAFVAKLVETSSTTETDSAWKQIKTTSTVDRSGYYILIYHGKENEVVGFQIYDKDKGTTQYKALKKEISKLGWTY